MKNKKKMALALITVLSLTAMTVSVFADTPAINSNPETSVQETQNGQQHDINKKTTNDTDSKTGDNTNQSRQHGRHQGKHDKEQVAEPENAIGKDSAKAKALEDAGVTDEQVNKVRSHLSQLDDGTVIYRVHFIYIDQRYSYQINAISGEIVDKHTDTAKDGKMETSRKHGQETNNTVTDTSTETAATA